jgi:hypothetical protein
MYQLDGTYTLEQTNSAIEAKEAAGRELTALEGKRSRPPTNVVEFVNLPAGERPRKLSLRSGSPGVDDRPFWRGEIYIEGVKRQAWAMRV